MYADDIVLLSQSSSGLQVGLKVIKDYCQKWKLCINITKTKVMIFSCKNSGLFKFNFGKNMLEITNRYTYPGIIFTPCGKFTTAKKELFA